jgi:hypothetical protein
LNFYSFIILSQSFLKKLERKPFEKRFDRKTLGNGVITSLFKKGLIEKDSMEYGRDQPAQRLWLNDCGAIRS